MLRAFSGCLGLLQGLLMIMTVFLGLGMVFGAGMGPGRLMFLILIIILCCMMFVLSVVSNCIDRLIAWFDGDSTPSPPEQEGCEDNEEPVIRSKSKGGYVFMNGQWFIK